MCVCVQSRSTVPLRRRGGVAGPEITMNPNSFGLLVTCLPKRALSLSPRLSLARYIAISCIKGQDSGPAPRHPQSESPLDRYDVAYYNLDDSARERERVNLSLSLSDDREAVSVRIYIYTAILLLLRARLYIYAPAN